MPELGEERYCGDHTRCYFDEQWDVIYAEDKKFYWRDKKNHITYDGNALQDGNEDELGQIVALFENEEEDAIWDWGHDDLTIASLSNW